MNKKTALRLISWSLGLLVLGLATKVWVSERLDGGFLTVYDIFPLLGISAFSLMWTHYVLGSLRRFLHVNVKDRGAYYKVSSVIVLFLILLHPGLLVAGLYRDGFGLPPVSYLTVYSENYMQTAIGMGTISLIIFLLFELKSRLKNKNWWKYIEFAQLIAMSFIFYHGLTLGGELSVGWYRMVWFFYGITFIAAVMINHWYDRSTNRR